MPLELNFARIARIAIVIGLLGATVALFRWGGGEALGFLVGSSFSYLTLKSWTKLAEGLGSEDGRAIGASALFLVLRFGLIAATIYVIVKVLGITPIAIAAGLLVSFAAVVVELFYGSVFAK